MPQPTNNSNEQQGPTSEALGAKKEPKVDNTGLTPDESRQSVLAMRSAMFAGPLPPPEILQGYNDIVPGSAARLLKMAEKQQEHRMELERNQSRSGIWRSYLGLGQALLSVSSLLLGVVLLPILGSKSLARRSVVHPSLCLFGLFSEAPANANVSQAERISQNSNYGPRLAAYSDSNGSNRCHG